MAEGKTVKSKGSSRKKPPAVELAPCLVVLAGPEQGAVFPLPQGDTVVGRDQDLAEMVLSDPRISRSHARFTVNGAGVTVVDLDSTNGLVINGEEMGQAELKPGDTISLSETTTLRLSLQDDQIYNLMMDLYRDAVLDATGVLTPKSFFSRLKVGPEASLAVIEVDGFQQVRDRHGVTAAEEVIGQVASVLRNGIAAKGLVARIGESFLVNLKCRALDADVTLDGVLRGIQYSNFRVEDKTGVNFARVTLSVGVASVVSEEDVDQAMSAAEEALAAAKLQGRNRLVVSERKKFGR